MSLLSWCLSIAKWWPLRWARRRDIWGEYYAALDRAEIYRTQRDEAVAKAESLRAAAQGWFPQDTAEAITALERLAAFVDAGWMFEVYRYPGQGFVCHLGAPMARYVPVPQAGKPVDHIRTLDFRYWLHEAIAETWTDAVEQASQLAMGECGKLPDPLPKEESPVP